MNIDKAISGNRRYAAAGLWTDRYPQILEVLEQGRTCGEPDFARSVHGWQTGRPRLRADGILGPRTWRSLEPDTRFSTVTFPPPPWLGQCIERPGSGGPAGQTPATNGRASGAARPVPIEKWRRQHLSNAAPDSIPGDLWRAAMRSRDHCMTLGRLEDKGHEWLKAELLRPEVVTLVDFRISSKKRRLWTVELQNGAPKVKFHLHVSHGAGSARRGEKRGPAVRVSNRPGSHMSSVGGAVTTYRTGRSEKFLGAPSLRIIGIDPTNDKVGGRNIIFHAAKYVSERGGAGTSWGCFATAPDANHRLLDFIRGGTFVYAYLGDSWLAPRD